MTQLSTETHQIPQQLSRDQARVVSHLQQNGPLGIRKLAQQLGMTWTRAAFLVDSLRTNNWRIVTCNEHGVCSVNSQCPRVGVEGVAL